MGVTLSQLSYYLKILEISGYYDNHLIIWGTLQKVHINGYSV